MVAAVVAGVGYEFINEYSRHLHNRNKRRHGYVKWLMKSDQIDSNRKCTRADEHGSISVRLQILTKR